MTAYYGQAGGNVPGLGPGGSTLGAIQVPTDLKPGDSAYLWGTVPAANAGGSDAGVKGEQPALLTASVPVSLGPMTTGGTPQITVEVSFYATATLNAAQPGTFEIDIQTADTDADAFYTLPTVAENQAGTAGFKIAAVDAITAKARVTLGPIGGRFVRAKLVARGNAVDFTVKVTRDT